MPRNRRASGTGSRDAYAISSADGTPLFYTSMGATDADAPTAILSDGIGCDGYVWKYLEADLQSDHRVLHWHYRGHGRTPRPREPGRFSIQDLADDLVDVLDDAEVDRAALFGHSMGVQVCLETYRRHPDRVSALLLLCGAPGTPLRTFRGSTAAETLLPAVRSAVTRAPRLVHAVAKTVLPTRLAYKIATTLEVNPSLIRQSDFMPYLKGLSLVDTEFFLSMLAEAGEHSARDVLPTIKVPTLVVAGDRDGFTPAELSREMAAAIPGSELLIVEGGSHTAPLERPELVANTVRAFLVRAGT